MGRGSKPGERRGGRVAGVPNRRSVALREAMAKAVDGIEKFGELSPLDFLLALMRDQQADRRDRLEAAKSAANFVHPRLVSQDINAKSSQVTWFISDSPPSAEDWLAEVGDNIQGRSVPFATTVSAVHALELEVRDKQISALQEQVRKLGDELALERANAARAREIPLLS